MLPSIYPSTHPLTYASICPSMYPRVHPFMLASIPLSILSLLAPCCWRGLRSQRWGTWRTSLPGPPAGRSTARCPGHAPLRSYGPARESSPGLLPVETIRQYEATKTEKKPSERASGLHLGQDRFPVVLGTGEARVQIDGSVFVCCRSTSWTAGFINTTAMLTVTVTTSRGNFGAYVWSRALRESLVCWAPHRPGPGSPRRSPGRWRGGPGRRWRHSLQCPHWTAAGGQTGNGQLQKDSNAEGLNPERSKWAQSCD